MFHKLFLTNIQILISVDKLK